MPAAPSFLREKGSKEQCARGCVGSSDEQKSPVTENLCNRTKPVHLDRLCCVFGCNEPVKLQTPHPIGWGVLVQIRSAESIPGIVSALRSQTIPVRIRLWPFLRAERTETGTAKANRAVPNGVTIPHQVRHALPAGAPCLQVAVVDGAGEGDGVADVADACQIHDAAFKTKSKTSMTG